MSLSRMERIHVDDTSRGNRTFRQSEDSVCISGVESTCFDTNGIPTTVILQRPSLFKVETGHIPRTSYELPREATDRKENKWYAMFGEKAHLKGLLWLVLQTR